VVLAPPEACTAAGGGSSAVGDAALGSEEFGEEVGDVGAPASPGEPVAAAGESVGEEVCVSANATAGEFAIATPSPRATPTEATR
jgi:hypothetical protein